jgi:hypothetical protein
MKRVAGLAMIAAFMLAGCGGGGEGGVTPAPIPPTVEVTGTWDASMTVIGGDTTVPVGYHWTGVLTVIQSGSAVSGTFSTSVGGVGQISGTVSGDEASFTSTPGPFCAGMFNCFVMVDAAGDQMSGTYSGADCDGTLQALITAVKR